MAQMKVLIADNLEREGVVILEQSSLFDITLNQKTTKEDLLDIIANYEVLIVRSASKVTQEVVENAHKLKLVVRAGVGVDNIDISACSQKGIVVMNAPSGNSISTAEQAIALMFAVSRFTPQANESTKQKKWEKSKFKGQQLTGKTCGVIGLGRIGKEMVKRAKGLQMKILGFDPFIPKENLEHLQIDLVDLETILKESDYITVHTPLTDSTKDIINKNNLPKLKKGVFLINAARGGIYNEEALSIGLEQGIIAGVGLDVFTKEPPPEDFPLYKYPNAVMTPHLGAATSEAQIEVAKETACSVVEYFKNGVAINSLNFPSFDPKEMDILTPWFELAEQVGFLATSILKDPIQTIQVQSMGDINTYNLKPLEIAISKGVMSVIIGSDEVNLVNAPIFIKERGLNISFKETSMSESGSVINFHFQTAKETLTFRTTINFSGGTVLGINKMPMEFKPEGNILVIKNKDVPNVVGQIGGLLGLANINIASLKLSRAEKGGSVTSILHLDEQPSKEVIAKLQEKDFIEDAIFVHIPSAS